MTEQIGPFLIEAPREEPADPRLVLALQPWIDVGSVGTMSLTYLEEAWTAQPIAQLARPGAYYDFTRYRPMLFRRGGERQVVVPNSYLHSARDPSGNDWLFLHALEPHVNGEDFVDGVLGLFRRFGVREYCLAGSMYAPVPHTRPPLVSGGASNDALRDRLRDVGVRESNYEGPTTIMASLPSQAQDLGIETATMIVQLPAYAQIERDYRGLRFLLELLSRMYDFNVDLAPVNEEAERQREALDQSAAEDPRLQAWLAGARELLRQRDAAGGGRGRATFARAREVPPRRGEPLGRPRALAFRSAPFPSPRQISRNVTPVTAPSHTRS